jgi:hypothetical protein
MNWAIGFYEFSLDRSSSEVSIVDPIVSAAGGRIIPLIWPRTSTLSQFTSGQYSEAVLRQYLKPKGRFWGVGEIILYEAALQSVTFNSPAMQTVFQVVNELKGIVMIHPSNVSRGGRPTELGEIEPSISKYPDAIFLFHGQIEVYNLASQLMSKYPNVYYTFDSYNWILSGPEGFDRLFPGGVVTDTFESFKANAYWTSQQEYILGRLVPLLQQYPDRVMWGTDLTYTPLHFVGTATDVCISLSRQVIGRLPADIQEKYAYKNALNVFGRFLTPSP